MKKILTMFIAAMVLSGCGAIAERAAEEVAEQAIERSVEGDSNGEFDVDFGGGDLPDGLTIDVPGGYEVLGSSTFSDDSETVVSASLTYPASDVEDLVQHFNDYFDGQDGINRQESNSDGFHNWTWSTDDISTLVGVNYSDGDAEAMVNITERTGG